VTTSGPPVIYFTRLQRRRQNSARRIMPCNESLLQINRCADYMTGIHTSMGTDGRMKRIQQDLVISASVSGIPQWLVGRPAALVGRPIKNDRDALLLKRCCISAIVLANRLSAWFTVSESFRCCCVAWRTDGRPRPVAGRRLRVTLFATCNIGGGGGGVDEEGDGSRGDGESWLVVCGI